jgi:biopolymer transport protein TolR
MAFSTNGDGGKGLSSEINVTPLIDILLVMLIILMVIVPVMPQGLNSALPSVSAAGAADATADRGPILVQVEQDQTTVRYVIDGVGIVRAEVAPRLLKLLSQRSVRRVLLKADAKLDFGVVAEVIDAGQAAGADSIWLVTPGADVLAR